MQRYRVVKAEHFWHVEPYGQDVSYQFRDWRSAMDMIYPAVSLALREKFDFDNWPEKLREFYGDPR